MPDRFTEPTSQLPRRTVAKGSAWALPVLAVASAAPHASASPAPCAPNLSVLASDFPYGQTGVVGGVSTTPGVSVSVSYASSTCNTTLYSGSYFRDFAVTWTIKNNTGKRIDDLVLLKPWMASRSHATPSLGWKQLAYTGTFVNGRYWWTGETQTCGYDAKTFPSGCINWGGLNTSTAQYGPGRTASLDVGVGLASGSTATTTITSVATGTYAGLIPTSVGGQAQLNSAVSPHWTMPAGTTTQDTAPAYSPTSGSLAVGATWTFTQILTAESTRALVGSIVPSWQNCPDTNDTFEGAIVLGRVCV